MTELVYWWIGLESVFYDSLPVRLDLSGRACDIKTRKVW